MGQFLAIGLVTKISVEKKEADKAQLDLEQLQEKMREEFHYVPELYFASEQQGVYQFILKNDIIHAQLIPFLEEIYPLLYRSSKGYGDVIETLHTLPFSEWLQWADGKPYETFQFDEYGMRDYMNINGRKIPIHYDSLLLSMEGNIMMEVYGRQFNFFKYTMMQSFKSFSIAGALRAYITG